MEEKKEKKNNLITIRITDEERETVEYLTDQLGKTISETLLKAVRFFLNTGEGNVTDEKKDREVKRHNVHVRMSDNDMSRLVSRSDELSIPISQLIRDSIMYYARFMRGHF